MILTTLTIMVYSLLTISILFFLGYGLTLLFIPKKLKSHAFWLTPWFSIFFLIFFLVIFGLLGFSVKQISPVLVISLLILNLIAFFKRKLKYKVFPLREVIIVTFVIISVLFNCRPLITGAKSLTTISLGNNDVVVYAEVSDYLVDHPISKSFTDKNASKTITSNYRWVPIIISFFLNLFQLKGFEFVYLFQVVLFALTVPIIYLLFKTLYKDSIFGLILCLFLSVFNVNLLYMLYHNFFGQIFFWGIEVFLLIFLFSYLSVQEIKSKDFLKYDFIIGLALSVLFFSYHEAVIFIIAPLFLFFLSRLVIKADIAYYLRSFIRIFFITGLTSFFSIINAIKIDFMQAFIGYPGQPIGWQLFRNKIPYANPFEALGFYSIHSFKPLPTILAVIFSLLIVAVIVKGIMKSKEKLLLISFLIVYLLFYYWTGISQRNFFSYNRALTYTLPLMIVVFAIGLVNVLFNNKKNRAIDILILILLITLGLYSAKKLSTRFITEYFSVGRDYQSLKNIQNNKELINESIYLENNISNDIPYWNDIWIRYFLNLNKFPVSPVVFKKGQKIVVPENGLILIHKRNAYINAPRIIMNKTIWENDFFKIGRLCNSDNCLVNSQENLSTIFFGQTSFEDNLLLSGWSIKESESRWAEGKKSNLRLIVKDDMKSKIVIEALTLEEPQTMEVFVDNQSIGFISLSKEFEQYSLNLKSPLSRGVHLLSFTFSHTYKPSLISQSNDNRDLAANFKQIRLK
mgnify:CR=1 FL=1